jgi:hypothetical protein
MAFWDEAPEDALTVLLQQPNPPLSEVLNEGAILQELRTGNSLLIAYLTRESVVSELCSWSMTLEHQSSKDFDRSSRIATEVLTCGTALATVLLNSAALKQFLTSFTATARNWDPLSAGHFQRVLAYLLAESDGKYLSNFPDIVTNTVRHLITCDRGIAHRTRFARMGDTDCALDCGFHCS